MGCIFSRRIEKIIINMPKLLHQFHHHLKGKDWSWQNLTQSLPFTDLQPLMIACIVVTGTILGVRHLGWLQPKVIPITLIGNSKQDPAPPPPNIPEYRVGFNDIVVDNLRR